MEATVEGGSDGGLDQEEGLDRQACERASARAPCWRGMISPGTYHTKLWPEKPAEAAAWPQPEQVMGWKLLVLVCLSSHIDRSELR